MAMMRITQAHSDAFTRIHVQLMHIYVSTGNDIEPYTGFEIHMMAPKVNSDENNKRFC